MLNRTRPISSLFAGLALLAAGLSAQPARDTRVVAEVEGRTIQAADLQDRLAAERRQALADNRLDAFGAKAADTSLDALVDVKVFAAAARAGGLAARADVQHAIDNAVDDVLAVALVAERAEKFSADEATLRRYYTEHSSEFRLPGRVRARHIIVKTPEEATKLLGQVRRNTDFAALAKANNVDTTRQTGGELGWVSRGVMVKPFDQALFSLKIGEISPVIQTTYGYHIVQVQEIDPGAMKPFPAVSAAIRQHLLETEMQAWKAELRRKHTVKVHEAVLKSLR